MGIPQGRVLVNLRMGERKHIKACEVFSFCDEKTMIPSSRGKREGIPAV